MKKHPVFLTLLLGAIIVFSGVSVAYYNTKNYAFEKNPKIFSYDENGFSLFDFNFYYNDIKRIYKDIYSLLPYKSYRAAPYVVYFDLPRNI